MRLIAFIWKALVGIALCLTPLTAMLVVGWTSRAMRRKTFKTWHADSSGNPGNRAFGRLVAASPNTRILAHWPNWFIAEDLGARLGDNRKAGAGWFRVAGVFVSSLGAAFWANAKAGTLAVLSTWAVTLPLMVLWLLSWWGGWENSFNKGYEQAWVGPVIGLGATAFIILAMTYVPLAQARQATEGTWRSFFDYRLLRSLATGNPMAMLKFALGFVLAGLIIASVRVGPLALGNVVDDIGQWPPRDVMALKLGYHLGGTVLAFGLFVALRMMAAKTYARVLLNAVRTGRLKADRLGKVERSFLADLNLLEPQVKDESGALARAVTTSGRGILRFSTAVVVLPLWLVFVAEIYIAQFLNHDWLAWVNHPLIQLPWMSGIRFFGFG